MPERSELWINVGRAAGQSPMHVHVHLIPRHQDDVIDPRGSVRRVREGKRAA